MNGTTIELTGIAPSGTITLDGVSGAQQTITGVGSIAERGPDGIGVPVGGFIGQVLMKASNDPYSTEWASISPVDLGLPYFDVKAYGAFGDGSADDTVAIKAAAAAALAAGGGIVKFPTGEYIISDTLPLYAMVTYEGVGIDSSFIFMTNANKDAFYGEDVSSMNLKDFVLEGQGSGTGRGVAFERNVADNTPYIKCDAIWVRNFGGDGIFIDRPIVSSFDTVISADNGGHGFNQLNGTSTNYKNCFANNNDKAGYYGETHQYCGYVSCAADSNGIGYYFHGCQGLEMSGGAEVTTSRGGSWDGTSIKLDACFVAQIRAAWIGQNAAVGIWVTGGSQNIEIFGAEDNSPEPGATNFVKVDSGCIVTTDQIRNITANSFATGTTTVINDGAGNMAIAHALSVGSDLTVAGISFLGTTQIYGNLTMEVGTTLTLASDPTSAMHAATKQYVDGLALNLGKRGRARAATTANVTISTALNNGDTLDGVSLATGDLVLVKNQTAPAENGVYVVGASPTRATEFDSYNEYSGSLIAVEEGSTNADTLWLCTSNDGGTLGTTAITFSKMVINGELLAANNLSDLASASTARTNLGVAIGVDVQAFNASTTVLGNTTTGSGSIVLATSPTLTTPTVSGAIAFSTSPASSLGFSSAATRNSLMMGVDTTSKNFLIVDQANIGSNYATANSTTPTLYVYSAAASGTATNQWISITHNGSNGMIAVGTGAVTTNQSVIANNTVQIKTTNASALTVGLNGGTNPALQVDTSTATSATGLLIKSAAAAAGVALSVISSGTNENLAIDAKGSGSVSLGTTSTGAILLKRSTTVSGTFVNTIASTIAFTVGANGTTNPQFQVDTSTATVATGLNVKGAAAGGGLAVSAISSGTNESLTLNAKGTGAVTLASVSTGGVGIGAAPSASQQLYAYRANASATSDVVAIRDNDTLGSSIALHVSNDTNFAYSGRLGVFELFNGSDTGIPLTAKNAGTGKNFASNDGTNDTFTLGKDGLAFLANLTAPGSNPSGGVYVYAEAGALKCRGSGGTVTTLGPA